MTGHQLEQTSHGQALTSALALMAVFKDKYFVYRDEEGKWALVTCELRDLLRRFERPEWPR